MAKRRTTVRYTEAELAALPSESDFARIDAMTEETLEAAIAADPDWRDLPGDWYRFAGTTFPEGHREAVEIQVDPDVLAWFRSHGKDYSRRMNAALRAFMIAQENAKR